MKHIQVRYKVDAWPQEPATGPYGLEPPNNTLPLTLTSRAGTETRTSGHNKSRLNRKLGPLHPSLAQIELADRKTGSDSPEIELGQRSSVEHKQKCNKTLHTVLIQTLELAQMLRVQRYPRCPSTAFTHRSCKKHGKSHASLHEVRDWAKDMPKNSKGKQVRQATTMPSSVLGIKSFAPVQSAEVTWMQARIKKLLCDRKWRSSQLACTFYKQSHTAPVHVRSHAGCKTAKGKETLTAEPSLQTLKGTIARLNLRHTFQVKKHDPWRNSNTAMTLREQSKQIHCANRKRVAQSRCNRVAQKPAFGLPALLHADIEGCKDPSTPSNRSILSPWQE